MKDNWKIRLYRFLAQHSKGALAWKFNSMKYDEIDYQYKSSQLAEYFAQKDGYWNLTHAGLLYVHFLKHIYSFKEVCKMVDVRRYEKNLY